MKKHLLIGLIFLLNTSSASAISLEEAVEIALDNNPSLIQTNKNIDSAIEQLKIAKGKKNFTLSVSGSSNANKDEGSSLKENASARLNASLPLYSGHKLDYNIDAADLYIKICQLNYSQSADDLTYQIASAYIDALEDRANHLVDVETRDNLYSHEQNISELYNAGSKAKIDLLRAQVETSNAHQSVIKSQAAYEVSLNNLASYLSVDSVDDVDELEPKNLNLTGIEDLFTIAIQNRYDIQADNLKIERGEYQLKSAKANWLPSVNASASTGLSAQSDRWDPTSNATAGVSASWNIFDSHVTRAEVDDAKIEIEKLKLALQSDKDSARKDLISAYKNLESALVRVSTTKAAVDLALEERFIATEKYHAGEGILLDILDSEVALSTAKKNHVNAKYDVLRYQFALNHALGNTMR